MLGQKFFEGAAYAGVCMRAGALAREKGDKTR